MHEPDQIHSWQELAALIEQCSDGGWIFRGEHSIFECLHPKAGRLSGERGSARKKPYDPEMSARP